MRIYTLNEQAFSDLTDDAAYWIGFLLADGCIDTRHNQLVVRLAACDRGHLDSLNTFLGSNRPLRSIGIRGGFATSSDACELAACSRAMCKDLAGFGVTPRKTFTARPHPALIGNLRFWTGVVDGDGCLYWVKGGKYPNRPGMNLYGTREVCSAFADFVAARFPTLPIAPELHKSIWVTRLAGIRVAKLVEEMYADGPALPRKRELARAFVQCYIDHPPRPWSLRNVAN